MEETNTEQRKPRTINELIDLPYSDMTEEEIERVIEFKAQNKARDAEHEARMTALHEALQESINIHRTMAEASQAKLEELTAHAIGRFEDVS